MPNKLKQFEKMLDFVLEKAEGKEEEEGIITGTLINHSVIDSYGDMFSKASIENLDISSNKFLLHMHFWEKPVGTMTLEKTIDGNLKFVGTFDLAKENGNYINTEAAKLYSLLKKGAPYQMSVGGYIRKAHWEKMITDKGEVNAYVIDEFDIVEGSLVLRGAVPGATVETVKIDNINNKEENMDKEMMEAIVKLVNEALEKFEKGDMADFKAKVKEFDEFKSKATTEDYKERMDNFEKMLTDTQELIRSGAATEVTKTEESRQEFVKYLRSGNVGNLELATKVDRTATGALIPELVSNEILKNLKDKSPFFMAGHIYTGSSNQIQIPVRKDRNGKNAVQSVAEGAGNSIDGDIEYTRMTIGAGQIQARFPLTDECKEDVAFDIEGEIREATGEDFGEYISNNTIKGVVVAGGNQIEGFMNNNDVLVSNTATSTITPDDLIKLKNKVKSKYRVGAAYYVSQELFEIMESWKDSAGRPLLVERNDGVATYTGATPYTFKGFPIIVDDYMDVVATGKMPAFFGNFKEFYAYFWRKGFTSELDRKVNERITYYYTRTRIGGKVRYPKRGARMQVS